jgi:hypothetical protein
VAAVLELALILLFILLLPALSRASRSLRAYVAEISYQARHDSLTGLSNRQALHENVSAALRRLPEGEHMAVLLIDLDRFKEVNDSLGHDAGDELLQEIAEGWSTARATHRSRGSAATSSQSCRSYDATTGHRGRACPATQHQAPERYAVSRFRWMRAWE